MIKGEYQNQDEMGRWRAEYTAITDQLLVPMEQKGEQSKWITLRVMRVLKRTRESLAE